MRVASAYQCVQDHPNTADSGVFARTMTVRMLVRSSVLTVNTNVLIIGPLLFNRLSSGTKNTQKSSFRHTQSLVRVSR